MREECIEEERKKLISLGLEREKSTRDEREQRTRGYSPENLWDAGNES
jgi:hypothetical protein